MIYFLPSYSMFGFEQHYKVQMFCLKLNFNSHVNMTALIMMFSELEQ